MSIVNIYTRWGTFQPDGLKRVDERVFKSTSQLTPATELFTVINALLIRMPAQSSCRKALLVSSTIITVKPGEAYPSRIH